MWKKIHTARCKALQSVSMPQEEKKKTIAGRSFVTWERTNPVSSKLGISFGRQREARTVAQGFINRNAPSLWQHWDLGSNQEPGSFILQKQTGNLKRFIMLYILIALLQFRHHPGTYKWELLTSLLSRTTWQMAFPICWGFGKQAKEISFHVGTKKAELFWVLWNVFNIFKALHSDFKHL